MIELCKHIENLLLDNDCVIVPDFGGFMAHHIDACYDNDGQLFFPPKRILGFNPQLTLNDSLLVQSYIETYDISYPEALKRIESEVNEIKQCIDNEGEYEFCGLGVIVLNDNHYIFEPCCVGILSPSLYGLSSIEVSEISIDSISTIVYENSINEEDTTEEKPDDVVEDSNANVVSINVIRNIAAACIVVLVFFLMPTPLTSDKNDTLAKTEIETSLLYKILPKSMTINEPKLTNTSHKITTKQIAQRLQHTENNPIENESYYSIVLASKTSLENAINYTAQLKSKGYKDVEIVGKGNSSKVLYGQYKTESKAMNVKRTLEDNPLFKDCWVMLIKK